MSDFIQRRLAQMENMGASLTVVPWNNNPFQDQFRVSSVKFANKVWTRVIRLYDGYMHHFEGNIETREAADLAAATFPEAD